MTNSAWVIFPSSVTLEMVRCALAPLGDAVSYYSPDHPTQIRIERHEPWSGRARLEVEDDAQTIGEINEDDPDYVQSRISDPIYFVLWYQGLEHAELILSTLARSTLADCGMIISPHGERFYEPPEYLSAVEK